MNELMHLFYAMTFFKPRVQSSLWITSSRFLKYSLETFLFPVFISKNCIVQLTSGDIQYVWILTGVESVCCQTSQLLGTEIHTENKQPDILLSFLLDRIHKREENVVHIQSGSQPMMFQINILNAFFLDCLDENSVGYCHN